jgi:hypothetical protein
MQKNSGFSPEKETIRNFKGLLNKFGGSTLAHVVTQVDSSRGAKRCRKEDQRGHMVCLAMVHPPMTHVVKLHGGKHGDQHAFRRSSADLDCG